MYSHFCVSIALPVVSVVKRPSSVIKANDALNITCMASGAGLQSVTWSKESDGAQLDDNNSHRLITGRLLTLLVTKPDIFQYQDSKLPIKHSFVYRFNMQKCQNITKENFP